MTVQIFSGLGERLSNLLGMCFTIRASPRLAISSTSGRSVCPIQACFIRALEHRAVIEPPTCELVAVALARFADDGCPVVEEPARIRPPKAVAGSHVGSLLAPR